MNLQLIIYGVISAVLGLLPLVVYPPRSSQAVGIDSALLFILPIFVTQAGALWYFLTSLSAFQVGLRKAYHILVAGLIMFCLAQLQLPVTIVMSLLNINGDLIQLLLLIPYIFGTMVMYIAMRKFAKLLDVHTKWMSFWLVLALGVVAAVISQVLPLQHVADVPDSPRFILAFIALSGSFGVAGAMVSAHIRRAIGPTYKRLMMYLTIALAVFGVGYLMIVVFQTLGSYLPAFLDTYTRFNLWLLPLSVVSFLFLFAGRQLRAVSHQYGSLSANSSIVDVVTSTAALASNPKSIDEMLDRVRVITAKKVGGAPAFTEAENHTLVAVYLDLEKYLTTQEPLRTFSKEDLRGHLPADFVRLLPQAG